MTTLTATERTLRDIALEQPSAIRVFERYGLDYCCGGRRPLAEACAEKQISLDQILEKLAEASADPTPAPTTYFQTAPLSELMRYIVRTHHIRVRQELPRLLQLSAKVAGKHGERQPELLPIEEICRLLDQDMRAHLAKEEEVLFPYIEKLEAAAETGELPYACFASVESPIQVMLAEHDAAGGACARARELSNNYTAPEWACPTYNGLYAALRDFELDLHQHVHLENNILFPRAIALEAKLLAK